MYRPLLLLLAISALTLPAPAGADDVQLYHSGGNRIRVAEYDPRELTDQRLPSAMLAEAWDTELEVQWDVAALLALLSKQVYDDDDEMLDHLFRGMGFTRWVSIKRQSMAAHVIASDRATVVVFRGTNITELEDWKKNFSAGFTTYSPADNHKFHRGFWDAYLLVRSQALKFIDRNRTDRLWVTGHSLGGAMATLCTIDIVTSREQQPVLVTFGQPRVTDSGGAQWIDQRLRGRYARFVHGNDIVPSVPPTVPALFPYAHAGRLIAMTEGDVQAAESVMKAASFEAAYCGSCGRLLQSHQLQSQPVYQPAIEPPPLTQRQFEELLPPELPRLGVNATVQFPDGRLETRAIIPHYFTDHFIAAYIAAVRGQRDDQQSVPPPAP